MSHSIRNRRNAISLHYGLLPAMAMAFLLIAALLATIAQAQVNSSTVTAVFYDGGRFVKIGPRQWQEQGDNGARFNFEEQGPDESAMYLLDRSRNVQIALDVSSGVIQYSHNNEPFRDLYRITRMQATQVQQPQQQAPQQQQAQTHTETYSCNEGIPLVVRFVNVGDQSLAFVSHDSFPEVRLEIAPSGSGSRYVGNGYELHTKGGTAIITINGTEDVCSRN